MLKAGYFFRTIYHDGGMLWYNLEVGHNTEPGGNDGCRKR